MSKVIKRLSPIVAIFCMAIAIIGIVAGTSRAEGPYNRYGDAPRHALVWSGDVDDTTIISLRGIDVRVRDIHGNASSNINSQVFGRLPDRPVDVILRDVDGRGNVDVVRQPNAENNYTAFVRIKDWQSGRGHYKFVLTWRGRGNDDE
jgi:hypothetical protein